MLFVYNFTMKNFGKHRLDSVLIKKEFCNSRSAKNFFLKNKIFVNRNRILDGKFLVDYKDKIEIYNDFNNHKCQIIEIPKDIYIAINKPKGVVCSRVSDSHKTVFEWLNEEIKNSCDFDRLNHQELHTVGRLDCETSGLLILTTDGNFSHFLTNPENKIEKKYFVRLRDCVSDKNQKIYSEKAKNGILLPAEKKAPQEMSDSAKIEWLCENECEITVTEGKFHEVRRIFLALQNEVVELKRISIGNFSLQKLSCENLFVFDLEQNLF